MAVRWASTPVLEFQSIYAGSIPVARSKRGETDGKTLLPYSPAKCPKLYQVTQNPAQQSRKVSQRAHLLHTPWQKLLQLTDGGVFTLFQDRQKYR